MKIKSHILLFILSVAGLAIAGGMFFYGIYIIKQTAIETGIVMNKVREATKKNVELNTIKKTITATEEDRSKLATYFVTDKSIVEFLGYLEELGTITSTDSSIVSVELDEQTNIVSVSMRAEGTYSNVIRFTKLLENMPYRIQVSRLALTAKESSAEIDTPLPVWEALISFELISYHPQ